MRLFLVVVLSALLAAAGKPQEPPIIPSPDKPETEDRLPNGKSQKDAIAKADYEASLKDAREMLRRSKELEAELEKNESFVVSLSSIRNTEEIEKLARRIRGRLKR